MLLGFEDVLVEAGELSSCGWTEDLIRRFLGEEDGRTSAPHFRGKRLWKMARVEAAERSQEFRDAFALSVARRSLTPMQVRAFIDARRMARQTEAFLRARERAANHH